MCAVAVRPARMLRDLPMPHPDWARAPDNYWLSVGQVVEYGGIVEGVVPPRVRVRPRASCEWRWVPVDAVEVLEDARTGEAS